LPMRQVHFRLDPALKSSNISRPLCWAGWPPAWPKIGARLALHFQQRESQLCREIDSSYLDPLRRGHIISWGHNALVNIFEPLGFK
jgi:hypothetical protein